MIVPRRPTPADDYSSVPPPMPPGPHANARGDGGGEDEGVGPGDDDLLDRIGHGDTAAFALFYDRHGNAAYGLACRILGETEAAADALERAFLSVWREPGLCGRSGGAAASLLSLVHRTAIDDIHRSSPPIDAARIWGDEALPGVPPLQHRAVTLAYFDGYRCAEIAEILGVPACQAPDELRLGMRALGRFFRNETAGQDQE